MWKIKDPKLKQWVNHFFSDERIDQACRAQLEDGTFYLALSDLENGVFLELSNHVFSQNTGEYNPNDWNPFPDVEPPKSGRYLVTIKKDGACYVKVNHCTQLGTWDEDHYCVVAFRALPAPYRPEDENETRA